MHMSTEETLISNMEKLHEVLERVKEMANALLADTVELGGEWEQEISTDLMDFAGRLGDIADEYNNLLDDARAISEGSVDEEDSYEDLDEEM